ncbi:MAG TPA: alpha-L-rhamnosidase C-terminal domain-containing protein [Thermoleophilaceae bacterium]|nr:alpha-L-rhamnosidase C-terminal domain-containing protein [Thermoleophilaceae bacterium]
MSDLQSPADAAGLSSEPIPQRDARDDLVVNPGPFAIPKNVTVEGSSSEVDNPDGLMSDAGGVTTLRTTGKHSARLIVDLGILAMGHLELGIARAEGAPIRVAHASFRDRVGPDGDGYGIPTDTKPSPDVGAVGRFPLGTDAHPWSRLDIFDPPSERTVFETEGKRETRYLLITLDGPGEVEIEFVRIRQAIYPVKYDGYFLCSDELVNRAWYHSAYTQDLATLSEKSDLDGACHTGPDGASPWMVGVPLDRVLFIGDVVWQAQAGYNQSSDFWWLLQNTLMAFPRVQNPDGSFPCASSHLVKPPEGELGEPNGWHSPEDGPDPDLALGIVDFPEIGFGPWSLHRDCKLDQFTPAWLSILADNYLYCGDADFVRPLLPVARRVVDFFRSMTNEHGLHYEPEDQRVNPDADIACRWNWDPPAIATGVDSYTNAAWHDAIRGLALLEEHVGRGPEEAQKLRDEAEGLRHALIEHLWDADAGAMILNGDDPRRDHTSDANAMQLCFRTLDAERAEAAMEFLESTLWTPFGTRNSEYDDNPYRPTEAEGGIHVFMTSMEQLGRMRYGDGERAVELVRRHWAHMLENGPGTGWYTMNLDGTPGDPLTGGAVVSWTTAVPALSEGVLGIRPTAPGFSEWAVAPQLSGLDWAEGRVPVPGGGISTRWRRTETGGFQLTVSAPDETEGEVAVPLLGEQRDIAMNGRIVWADGTPASGVDAEQVDDSVIFRGLIGEHTFAWAQA